MIKWKSKDGWTLGFGLSHRNLERLKEGKPIKVNGHEMGVPYNVVLHAGETEDAIVHELRRNGMLPHGAKMSPTMDGGEVH